MKIQWQLHQAALYIEDHFFDKKGNKIPFKECFTMAQELTGFVGWCIELSGCYHYCPQLKFCNKNKLSFVDIPDNVFKSCLGLNTKNCNNWTPTSFYQKTLEDEKEIFEVE